jgi:hypothetical protein
MTLVLDMSAVAVRDRTEVVREAIHRTIVQVEIGWPDETASVAYRTFYRDAATGMANWLNNPDKRPI